MKASFEKDKLNKIEIKTNLTISEWNGMSDDLWSRYYDLMLKAGKFKINVRRA